MKAKEFIVEEKIFEAKFGGFDLQFTQHFLDRLIERGISLDLVKNILSRLDRAKSQIQEIGTETSINIYDRRTDVHVVVSKPSEESNKLSVITAYKNDQYHGKNPVIKIR